jgi:hypothetical protein
MRKARINYLAFGSNMDPVQMTARCPSARYVRSVVVPEHAIKFAGWSTRWYGAVATFEPKRGATLPGVLWTLTPEDVLMLDGYEGVPMVYDRAFVRTLDDDARERNALTYRMVNETTVAPPSFRYVEQIARAYLREGFPIGRLMAQAKRAGLTVW